MVKYKNNLRYSRNYRQECLLSLLLSSEGFCQCNKARKIGVNSGKWKIRMSSFTNDTLYLKKKCKRMLDELLD